MNVRIILHTPALSGIGKYVTDISVALNKEATLYSLLFQRGTKREDYLGEIYTGKILMPLLSGWYLNSHFQRVAFRNFFNQMLLSDTPQTVYHYVDYAIRPATPVRRSIITVHDFFHVGREYKRKYNYGTLKYIERNLHYYRRFENILTVSKRVRDEAKEYGFESDPTVIYPPVAGYFRRIDDRGAIREKYSLPKDKVLILSVSTDDPRKNLSTVVKTVKSLGEKYLLVRVGPAVDGAYNFSNLSPEQINEVYNACDLLLFPTLDEGFGYPLVEAMSLGLPIVSSDIPVVREITAGSAMLVNPDVEGCRRGIKELEGEREFYVKRGLERSKTFSFEVFASKIKQYYQNIERRS